MIVDNQSTDLKVLEYMKSLEGDHSNIRILKYNKPFNYSAINNYAVTKANGSVLGLINNDTEVITPEWLTEMVSHAIRPEIGCVGAMLYYPDGTIQHGGVSVGINKTIDHAFKGLKNKSASDYHNYLNSIRNPKALTAATLLINKILFRKISGFDEKNLPIAFNDVDLCLKVYRLGYQNLFIPHTRINHHESKSRAKIKENRNDYFYLTKKHKEHFKEKYVYYPD